MPWKPMPPCRIKGCPNPSAGHGLCLMHETARRADYDATRPGGYARGYDQAWASKRRDFLLAHPLCSHCGERATEAHHLVAKRDGGSDADSNLAPLCRPCHSRITATTQGFARGK